MAMGIVLIRQTARNALVLPDQMLTSQLVLSQRLFYRRPDCVAIASFLSLNPKSCHRRQQQRHVASEQHHDGFGGAGGGGEDGKDVNTRTLFNINMDHIFDDQPTIDAKEKMKKHKVGKDFYASNDVSRSPFHSSPTHRDIIQASSIDELLHLIDKTRTSRKIFASFPGASLSLLTSITKLVLAGSAFCPEATTSSSLTPSSFCEDERFFRVLSLIDNNLTSMPTPLVASALRNLVILYKALPALLNQRRFVKSLESFENECCWRFRDMDLRILIRTLQAYPSTGEKRTSQNCLEEAATKQLDLRWVELSDASLIIDLLYLLKDPPESLQRHVDTRILELVENMTAKQLVTILGFSTQTRNANIPLLKGLAYHLSKSEEPFTIDVASTICFSLASVSFVSHPLMEKICRDVLSNNQSENSGANLDTFHLSSLLVSFAKLRWRHPEILNLLCDSLLEKCQSSKGKIDSTLTCQKAIKTLSHLNFSPDNLPQLSPYLLDSLASVLADGEGEGKDGDLLLRIDFVFSLSVLGLASPRHVESVLKAANRNSTLPEKSVFKILQINSHAILDSPSPTLSVPSLNLEISKLFSLSLPPPDKTSRSDNFRFQVSQFLPAALVKGPKKYIVEGPLLHPSGHQIDFVIVVDAEGNTLPVPDELETALKTTSSSEIASIASQLVAPNNHAVAILLYDVFDQTNYTENPIGEKASATRHLRGFGFKPCVIEMKKFNAEPKKSKSALLNSVITNAVDPTL